MTKSPSIPRDVMRLGTSHEYASLSVPPLRGPAGDPAPNAQPRNVRLRDGLCVHGKALGSYILCLLQILFLSRELSKINIVYTKLFSVELVFALCGNLLFLITSCVSASLCDVLQRFTLSFRWPENVSSSNQRSFFPFTNEDIGWLKKMS